MDHRQTVHSQIRCRRFSTVCLQFVLLKLNKVEKYHPTSLKMEMGLVKLIMGKSIQLKWVKVVRDPCQKITLLLLKSKSVRVIVPESCFKREYLFPKTVDIILP